MRDLGEGVKRMASSMSVANNSLEESMGLLVASTDKQTVPICSDTCSKL